MTTYTFTRYATNVLTIPTVTDTAEIWFTVKKTKSQLDSESMLQISKTGGLLYINGLTPTAASLTSSDASVAVSAGSLLVTLSVACSALLQEYSSLVGEVKNKTTGGVVTVNSQFTVQNISAITRTV
jgi:hypothetical protein